jgi:dephospho-CoA kinase
MPDGVLRVGLTGGIATGKSFCLRRFAELGAATIDADIIARDVVAPGTPGLAAVVRRFGAGVVDASGALDRAALGRVVFADDDARRDLERIVHPAVYDVVEGWFAAQAAGAPAGAGRRIAMADIPLLYETGQAGRFDCVIVAACPPDLQVRRVMARDGLSDADARRRIAAQMPIDDKRARADYVIDTSGSFDDTRRHVDRVWAAITHA